MALEVGPPLTMVRPMPSLGLQSPDSGIRRGTDSRNILPFGIMVNHRRRFVDEGADFRNYTYAKWTGDLERLTVRLAGFDQKVTHLLRDEYRIRRVSKVTGQTLADLADKMEGVDKQGFLDEIQHYNNAVQRGIIRSQRERWKAPWTGNQ